jgi:hypothetical protein
MFTGSENHDIRIDEAAALTARYRAKMQANDKQGGFFGRDAIEAILSQARCVGIRYYYGLDSQNQQVMVLVGVDEFENDLADGILAEASVTCPPRCSENNSLNS